MKILTYNSFGGTIPKAVRDFAEVGDHSLAFSPELINFVESFRFNRLGKTSNLDRLLKTNSDMLFWESSKTKNGIQTDTYIGWGELSPMGGVGCRVSVNQYDEATTKVMISEYDGAQALVPVPEYVPVPNVPGLYQAKRKEGDT